MSTTPKLPSISAEKIQQATQRFATPFHLYDQAKMQQTASQLHAAFSWNSGYKQYFAVKACPNPHIMKLLFETGMGMDCSSEAELQLCQRLGISGQDIMFTSNNTAAHEYELAHKLGAIINIDDISHIPFIKQTLGSLPPLLSFRYNPGPLRGGNAIIGTPEEAKYGFTREQIFQGYELLLQQGVRHFGLHTMVVSNELIEQNFIETAQMMFELAEQVRQKLGIRFEFINLGGGIGVAYKPDQTPVSFSKIGQGIEQAYQSYFPDPQYKPRLATECGRVITGPAGYLITRARHTKQTYKNYIGVDACMADLMRPGMYGAYHHITVLGKEQAEHTATYDVVGSLCENNDKFAINRDLPTIDIGDIVVIHDAGAHGHAMGFNYNGKLRSAEVLLRNDGSFEQIRRAETLDDLFATLSFPAAV